MWRLGKQEFSFTKNPESDFFIKNQIEQKKVWRVGGEELGCS